jgi:membrane protein
MAGVTTPQQEQPIGDLVRQVSEQTSTLVRQEIRLAQLELQEKGKHAGIGVGMFGSAGLIALYGIGFLLAAGALALATAVDPWLAALITGVVLLAGAGIAALAGKSQIDQATPPVPEQAVDSSKQDVDEVKEAAHR